LVLWAGILPCPLFAIGAAVLCVSAASFIYIALADLVPDGGNGRDQANAR
jgi:hypothetical protein